jgi:ribonucleotide monophosphatase NagD (HAD superfamily)
MSRRRVQRVLVPARPVSGMHCAGGHRDDVHARAALERSRRVRRLASRLRHEGHEAACSAIWSGAKLYSASDAVLRDEQGRRSVTYAIIGAIRRLTKARVILTGKPSMHALKFVARRLGLPVTEVGVIGDDPLVETIMARRGGATAVGVTTGMTSREEWSRQPDARRPHFVLERLTDLLNVFATPPT